MMIVIAIAVMVCATMATHLGVSQAVSIVISRICKCHKCLTFWATLAVFLLLVGDIVSAFAIAICNAYLSNWFGLLLVWLNNKYNELWQRLNRKTNI